MVVFDFKYERQYNIQAVNYTSEMIIWNLDVNLQQLSKIN